MIQPGEIIIHDKSGESSRWLYFTGPLEIIAAENTDEIVNKLKLIEKAVEAGYHAAGFISYEAAPAFDPAFRVRTPSTFPLIWFGIYLEPKILSAPPSPAMSSFKIGEWAPSENRREYRRKIERIKRYIAAGETYQVNYTLRLTTGFQGEPYDFWLKLLSAQPEGYAAYLDTGRFAICSASPELFFSLNGPEIISRPMKGTAPRGLTLTEDREKMDWLKNSGKNKAENLMIVDMVRNDLGRIAETGSVRVSSLFDIERYPTVLQMTSTVQSMTSAPISEIFAALFPCASITGAPKIRTMEIIAELEDSPRGIYTGAIGFISPAGRAQFNVAIRTATIDREKGTAEYGAGGGIVWDSESDDEFAECLTKAQVLVSERPDFELLESLLWKPVTGYYLLERHLTRLADSAEYFGFPIDLRRVVGALSDFSARLPERPFKVRLRLDKSGDIKLDSSPLEEDAGRRIWKIAIAPEPVDPADPFLYHKTTNRQIYEKARAGRPECDDVLLWNKRGEATESTIANLVVDLEGKFYTPPTECGLLPGTCRDFLLESGLIRERVISLDELRSCRSINLVNSVRKWVQAELSSA